MLQVGYKHGRKPTGLLTWGTWGGRVGEETARETLEHPVPRGRKEAVTTVVCTAQVHVCRSHGQVYMK